MTPDRDARARLLALARAAEEEGPGVLTVPAAWLLEALAAPVAPMADLTVPELARLFGKAASTVRGWLEADRFPGAYQLHGKQWRVPPAALEAFQARARLGRAVGAGEAVDLGAWRDRAA